MADDRGQVGFSDYDIVGGDDGAVQGDIVGFLPGPGGRPLPMFSGRNLGNLRPGASNMRPQPLPQNAQPTFQPGQVYSVPGQPQGVGIMMGGAVQGRGRRQPLPIGSITLAAGASGAITLTPQRLFRPERLVLTSSLAIPTSVLTDFVVGASTQFVATGAIGIAVFGPLAEGTSLRGDTASPGTTITLTFTNNGAAAETISGAILGEAVET